MKRYLAFLVLLALAFSIEGVEELKDANFAEKVYSEPKFWLVMFSASWVPLRLFLVRPLHPPQARDRKGRTPASRARSQRGPRG